jgi:hypothetical protein
MDEKIIRSEAEKLYLWQKQKDENAMFSTRWSIGDGYLFDFYHENKKIIAFVDSVYERSKATADSASFNFKPGRDQLLYLTPDYQPALLDITASYLADSLKHFNPDALKIETAKIVYDPAYLKITNKDTARFTISGLHADENGSSWTNGDVSFSFRGDFLASDSLLITLNTYMPPACKNIKPDLLLADQAMHDLRPRQVQRNGDSFKYTFRFDKPTFVSRIMIYSDTIQARPPDTRRLSFPFISLEIKSKAF